MGKEISLNSLKRRLSYLTNDFTDKTIKFIERLTTLQMKALYSKIQQLETSIIPFKEELEKKLGLKIIEAEAGII